MPVRGVGWCILLTSATAVCAGWSSLPTLESAPVLRVCLFAGLGLLGAAMTLSIPSLPRLLFAAILLRVALLPAPISDDVHRYLWEGKLIRHGIDPHAQTADSPGLTHLRDAHWEQMNHRDRPTAYPPLAELAFAAVGSVSYHPLALKLLFLASDLTTLWLLISLLQSRGLPMHQAGWYAFNPVVLIGISAEAHYDALFVLTLTTCWWAAERKRSVLAWLALAASIQLKLVSLLLLPFLLNRRTLPSFWYFGVLLLLPAIPFLASIQSFARSVLGFAQGGWFNGLPYLLLQQISPSLLPIAFLSVLISIWFCWRKGKLSFADSSFWTLGSLLVLSPIIHFWYLLWIAPLLALQPSLPWLIFCLSQAGYFLAWQTLENHGWWGLPIPVVTVIWLPFLGCGTFEIFRQLHNHRKRKGMPQETSPSSATSFHHTRLATPNDRMVE